MKVVELDVDALQPNPENPNVQEPQVFNQLVESIQEDGLDEPILVTPGPQEGAYTIVAGEHRWKAAKLAGLAKVWCVVQDGWDGDAQALRLVRRNVLKGKLDPKKFTRLYQRLAKRYDPAELQKKLGFSSRETAFRSLLRQMEEGLPLAAREEIRRRAEKIQSVEDVAAVINSLYAKYGATLEYSFMIFVFGGKPHVVVRLKVAAYRLLQDALSGCAERGEDANDWLVAKLTGGRAHGATRSARAG